MASALLTLSYTTGVFVKSLSHIYRDTIAASDSKLLMGIQRGLEKEGLRVNSSSAMLSQQAHPPALGSALTHPSITTDYSEALLEFITPVTTDIQSSLRTLRDIQTFTAANLKDELVWGASMPCIVAGDAGIPIANYGSSNVGTMKRVYRNGLGVRYGRMMQAIAGIHYNFSMPDSFWEQAWARAGETGTLQDFKTDGYLGLIRNFFSRVWLLIYLTGASPAVCASFLAGNRNHHLQPFDSQGNSLHLPYATSLRMGDLGYNSAAQASLQVCYNRLDQYLKVLHEAIVTPHAAYQTFLQTTEGEKAQLNDSLLQIENEFYSPIRPKRVTRSGEAPLVALQRAGIEYIEVRCIDINPYLDIGIDEQTIRMIDIFLLDCLLSESPACDDNGRARDKENLRRVVDHGRSPNLTLSTASGEVTFAELAAERIASMTEVAAQLDAAHGGNDYARAIELVKARCADPSQTPSGRILGEMASNSESFWQLALRYSHQWHEAFLAAPLPADTVALFEQESAVSIEAQRHLEASDTMNFETYLSNFYEQYRGVKL